jgi:hypothetical protein
MSVSATYVTHAHVAMTTDAALISFLAPSGPVQDGAITTQEAARLVLGFCTLRKLATLLSQKVADLDALEASRAADSQAGQVTREVERRAIVDQEERPDQPPHRLQ